MSSYTNIPKPSGGTYTNVYPGFTDQSLYGSAIYGTSLYGVQQNYTSIAKPTDLSYTNVAKPST